ncbi:hypothetical protein FVER53590_25706 [Fusarium verticillioides]|nr:hypothetical protein FVER53590_25706 [Fusarium verticillioides]
MNSLSTEEIVTILSTIPGLMVSCLSAWFAYLALQRRHVARNDIETATIEFIIRHVDATQSKIQMQSFHETSTEIFLLSENLPQLPPAIHRNITGEGYRRIEVLPPARVDLQNNLQRPGPLAA